MSLGWPGQGVAGGGRGWNGGGFGWGKALGRLIWEVEWAQEG